MPPPASTSSESHGLGAKKPMLAGGNPGEGDAADQQGQRRSLPTPARGGISGSGDECGVGHGGASIRGWGPQRLLQQHFVQGLLHFRGVSVQLECDHRQGGQRDTADQEETVRVGRNRHPLQSAMQFAAQESPAGQILVRASGGQLHIAEHGGRLEMELHPQLGDRHAITRPAGFSIEACTASASTGRNWSMPML